MGEEIGDAAPTVHKVLDRVCLKEFVKFGFVNIIFVF